MSPEWQQALAAEAAKYPLPSQMRGDAPARAHKALEDIVTSIRAGYPVPSEMRARRAAEAVRQKTLSEPHR